MIFQKPLIFAVFRAHDAELAFGIVVSYFLPFGRGIEIVHEGFCTVEGPVDDIYVVNFLST